MNWLSNAVKQATNIANTLKEGGDPLEIILAAPALAIKPKTPTTNTVTVSTSGSSFAPGIRPSAPSGGQNFPPGPSNPPLGVPIKPTIPAQQFPSPRLGQPPGGGPMPPGGPRFPTPSINQGIAPDRSQENRRLSEDNQGGLFMPQATTRPQSQVSLKGPSMQPTQNVQDRPKQGAKQATNFAGGQGRNPAMMGAGSGGMELPIVRVQGPQTPTSNKAPPSIPHDTAGGPEMTGLSEEERRHIEEVMRKAAMDDAGVPPPPQAPIVQPYATIHILS